MRKVVIIFALGLFVGGCSVTHYSNNLTIESSKKGNSGTVLDGVRNQNITLNNFFVEKAEIEIETENGKEKFISSIKFENPDRFLISIKSRTGIEGVRIYLNKDSILVNDRINKKFYVGNSLYFKKKYGLTQSFLPLIFGDVVLDKNCDNMQNDCVGDKLFINCVVNGMFLTYNIDCKKRKAVLVSQKTNYGQQGVELRYNKFYNVGDILVPKIVELDDDQYNTRVKIKILKVESPWNGTIKFIPGKGYEKIELV